MTARAERMLQKRQTAHKGRGHLGRKKQTVAERATHSTTTRAGATRAGRLQRAHDARLGGVCAGIAKYYATDPDMVRLIAVLLVVLTLGALSVVYVVLWLVLPVEDVPAGEVDGQATALSSDFYGAVADAASGSEGRGKLGLGVVLALVFGIGALVALMAVFLSSMTRAFSPVQFWPLALVAAGIVRMVIPDASGHHGLSAALGVLLFAVGMVMLLGTLGIAQLNVRAWLFEGAPLLLGATGLLLLGRGMDSSVLFVCGLAVLALFCLVGVVFYLEPGSVRQFMAWLPNGRSVSIVVIS